MCKCRSLTICLQFLVAQRIKLYSVEKGNVGKKDPLIIRPNYGNLIHFMTGLIAPLRILVCPYISFFFSSLLKYCFIFFLFIAIWYDYHAMLVFICDSYFISMCW